MRLVIAMLAGSLVCFAACSSNPVVVTRTVTIHAPAACAPGASPYVLFDPLGDFEPQGAPPSLPLGETGTVLTGFPSSTQEIAATVTGGSSQWAAHEVLAGSGAIDLLALPLGLPCALTDPIGARTGAVLGAIDEGHVLIVGGTAAGAVPATVLVDLTRGTAGALPVGLLTPRTEATVTAWSGRAVVAGGVQSAAAGGGTLSTFEIYDSSVGDFTGATYTLSQARARHGAAVMVDGETLLVGGVDASGAVLGSMEAIDSLAQRARTAGLGSLQVPRADPVVMRLASGEILVAGGVDASGNPVATLEWFLPDGSAAATGARDLVASSNRAFVPLAAGGALAVIAPDTATAGFQNVWVVSADHGLEAATPIAGALTVPQLFAGTTQAPALWTGDRWLVWQPWVGSFGALTSTPIGTPGPTGDPIASPEPGLGAWADGTSVYALRFGPTRGPYATPPVSSPLLLVDTSFTAPDRLVVSGAAGAVTFDPASGLTLQPGASVFVTDATFASFTLDAETPGGAPPAIVLRDDAGNETVLDGSVCSFVAGSSLHVERDGDAVSASVNGGALAPCSVAPASGARVSIGVRGEGSGASVVQGVGVTRT